MPGKRARAGRLSLHPIEFREAVSAILQVKPSNKPKKKRETVSTGTDSGADQGRETDEGRAGTECTQ